MRSLYAASAAVALALLIAACGGGSSDSGSSDTSSGGSGDSGAASKDAGQAAGGGEGETIFASNCGSCHTLSAAGTAGAVGPNLDDLKPAKATVVSVVTNGQGAMPSFSSSLSSAEIDEVATYVSKNAGQ